MTVRKYRREGVLHVLTLKENTGNELTAASWINNREGRKLANDSGTVIIRVCCSRLWKRVLTFK